MIIRTVILLLSLLAAPAATQDWNSIRPKPKEGYDYPDCYCTNRGVRVEVGQRACLKVDGKEFTALCSMSLNNPAWRREREGCAPDGLTRSRPASAQAAPG